MKPIALLLLATSAMAAQPLIDSDVKPPNWAPCYVRDWNFTVSGGLGYRRDRQKLAEPTFTTRLTEFNSVTTNFSAICAWERFLLKFNADYGWLCNGTVAVRGFAPPYAASEPFPTFNTASGYTADVQGAAGCRIKFWTFCNGSLSFIPALGYNYSHFNAFPKRQEFYTPNGASGFTSLCYTRPIQQDWYGPYAEGRIAFSWLEKWRFDVYYQYTHVRFRQTLTQSVTNFFYTLGGALNTANTSLMRVSSKGNTLRTQLGGLDLSYRACAPWQIGLHFEGSSTWSQSARSIVHTKTQNGLPTSLPTNVVSTEKLSVQWNRYAFNLYGSYWF